MLLKTKKPKRLTFEWWKRKRKGWIFLKLEAEAEAEVEADAVDSVKLEAEGEAKAAKDSTLPDTHSQRCFDAAYCVFPL